MSGPSGSVIWWPDGQARTLVSCVNRDRHRHEIRGQTQPQRAAQAEPMPANAKRRAQDPFEFSNTLLLPNGT